MDRKTVETLGSGTAALALAALLAAPAGATKPCSPDTWVARPDRPAAEWARLARWVAVARVTARRESVVPYANCYLKDKSGCVQDDQSTVTLKVKRWEKGGPLALKSLGKQYCAPPAPNEVGGLYRFYGVSPEGWIYFEKVRR
ncbi:MAG: hypothetical protein HY553_05790 [Elusimicrobia bacterium]|nr:hypothetical protein [Elusimicrobiota bacterium]